MTYKCGTCGNTWLAHHPEAHRIGCPDVPRERPWAMRSEPDPPITYEQQAGEGDYLLDWD